MTFSTADNPAIRVGTFAPRVLACKICRGPTLRPSGASATEPVLCATCVAEDRALATWEAWYEQEEP